MFEQFEDRGREAISVSEFRGAIGMGRATYERLDDKPAVFRLGVGPKAKRMIAITEARAWVERGVDGQEHRGWFRRQWRQAAAVPADLAARINDLLVKNNKRSWGAALRDVLGSEIKQPVSRGE